MSNLFNIQNTIRQSMPEDLEWTFAENKKSWEGWDRERTALLKALQRIKPGLFQELQDRNTDRTNSILDFVQFYSDDREMLPYRREAMQNQVHRGGYSVPWGHEDSNNLHSAWGKTGAGGLFSPVTGQAMIPGKAHEYVIPHEATHGEDYARGLLHPSGFPAPLDELEQAHKLHNDIYQADKRYLLKNERFAEDPMAWEHMLIQRSKKAGSKGSLKRFKE